jgi:hypothetical protein
MWLLESTKDRNLGVDTPGQQVPPRVRYGTACLLIRDAIGCQSCSVVWGKAKDVTRIHMVQEGPEVRGTLALQVGPKVRGNRSKA